jgi:hypothetical protein
VLLERLASLADKHKQLNLRHTDDSNPLALCFRWQNAIELTGWNEERFGQLMLMRLCFLEQLPNRYLRWLRLSGWGERIAQDEAARGIHERDAIELTFQFSANRQLVQLERKPGFVDLELLRMKPPWAAGVTCRSGSVRAKG